MRKRVLFRADGNEVIGLGHVYRSIAIAERLQDQFDCFLAIRNVSESLRKNIPQSLTIIDLSEDKTYEEEAIHITQICSEHHIDIITLDGYLFNTDYQKVLKEKSHCRLVSIDDDQPFHYVSDIVINHAGGVGPQQISKEPYSKVFLGYDYLLLRKEFIKQFNIHKHISGIQSILICFGGADPDNFTQKTIESLKQIKDLQNISVILGASYSQRGLTEQFAAEHPQFHILNNLSAEALSKLMSETDLAIIPSSTISLEAFASKMIIITGMTADNQQNIYNGLIKEETVMGIGKFDQFLFERLPDIITELSNKFSDYAFQPQTGNLNDSLPMIYQSA